MEDDEVRVTCYLLCLSALGYWTEAGLIRDRHSFYAHVVNEFGGDGPQLYSRVWTKLVEAFVLAQVKKFNISTTNSPNINTTTPRNEKRTNKQPPLLSLQLGANITSSTLAMIYHPNEIECYVRLPPEEKATETGKGQKRGITVKKEEEREDRKKRRIRDAKKRDLLLLLEGM